MYYTSKKRATINTCESVIEVERSEDARNDKTHTAPLKPYVQLEKKKKGFAR